MFDLSFPAAVTSDQVDLEGFTQLENSGDLIIQQMITNTSPAALNAQAYALVPGYPRQQRFLLDLQPGQTTIKRFIFPSSSYVQGNATVNDIANALMGKSATLGLRQSDGRTLLTKSIPLE